MVEKVPDDIQTISRCLDRFHSVATDAQQDWTVLKDKAIRVYVMVLAIVEGMLAWLDEKAWSTYRKRGPSSHFAPIHGSARDSFTIEHRFS